MRRRSKPGRAAPSSAKRKPGLNLGWLVLSTMSGSKPIRRELPQINLGADRVRPALGRHVDALVAKIRNGNVAALIIADPEA